MNADGKIVGVLKLGNRLPKMSQEPRNEKGGAVLPKLKQIDPTFTALTEDILEEINMMMEGEYEDEFQVKTFGARVAYYADGLFSIFCTFLFPINVCDQKRVVHSKYVLNILH